MPEDQTRIFEDIKQDELERLAHVLAPLAQAGDFIALRGNLGAGKSVFARAFIRTALGDENRDVPSPTYNLVQPYETGEGYPDILHVDLYRLEKEDELRELGLDDAADCIILLEWPERLGTALPDDAITIDIGEGASASTRTIKLDPGPKWHNKIENLTLIRT